MVCPNCFKLNWFEIGFKCYYMSEGHVMYGQVDTLGWYEFQGPSVVQYLQGSIYTANNVCDFVAASYNWEYTLHVWVIDLAPLFSNGTVAISGTIIIFLQKLTAQHFGVFTLHDMQQGSVHVHVLTCKADIHLCFFYLWVQTNLWNSQTVSIVHHTWNMCFYMFHVWDIHDTCVA